MTGIAGFVFSTLLSHEQDSCSPPFPPLWRCCVCPIPWLVGDSACFRLSSVFWYFYPEEIVFPGLSLAYALVCRGYFLALFEPYFPFGGSGACFSFITVGTFFRSESFFLSPLPSCSWVSSFFRTAFGRWHRRNAIEYEAFTFPHCFGGKSPRVDLFASRTQTTQQGGGKCPPAFDPLRALPPPDLTLFPLRGIERVSAEWGLRRSNYPGWLVCERPCSALSRRQRPSDLPSPFFPRDLAKWSVSSLRRGISLPCCNVNARFSPTFWVRLSAYSVQKVALSTLNYSRRAFDPPLPLYHPWFVNVDSPWTYSYVSGFLSQPCDISLPCWIFHLSFVPQIVNFWPNPALGISDLAVPNGDIACLFFSLFHAFFHIFDLLASCPLFTPKDPPSPLFTGKSFQLVIGFFLYCAFLKSPKRKKILAFPDFFTIFPVGMLTTRFLGQETFAQAVESLSPTGLL